VRKRSQRLWFIGAAAVLAAGGVGLAAIALKDTVAYAYTPSQIEEKDAMRPGLSVRLGGIVQPGSVVSGVGAEIHFTVMDHSHTIPVVTSQVLPDLFAEGQGVVAEGRFDENGRLIADRVLAKHDENYMPKEVYDAMRKQEEATGVKTGYGDAP
jgi:cytochrome c-type biogenesis protein CcmE